MEDSTFIFQLAAQLDGIGQVAVVAQCHGAAAMAHDPSGLSLSARSGCLPWRSARDR